MITRNLFMFFFFCSFFNILFPYRNLVQASDRSSERFSIQLEEPRGLLADNEKVKKASSTISWIIQIGALIATICFLLMAGNKLSQDDFKGAIGPFLGALVTGISSFLANSIMN